jgi:AraC-like DNA-binding protein
MRELVIPLMRDDALLGILFVGQCRTESENKATIQENAKNMSGNPEKFLRLYQELPLVPKKDILLIETILLQYFETKILSNELLRPESLGGVDSRTLAETVYYYIKQNYRYTLSTKHLSDTFFVNPSYLSRRFSQCYGITITDFIAKVRVEHAKRLLITTNASIGSISLNVGYDNANYFTRVFKKNVGFSPTDYRTNHRC